MSRNHKCDWIPDGICWRNLLVRHFGRSQFELADSLLKVMNFCAAWHVVSSRPSHVHVYLCRYDRNLSYPNQGRCVVGRMKGELKYTMHLLVVEVFDTKSCDSCTRIFTAATPHADNHSALFAPKCHDLFRCLGAVMDLPECIRSWTNNAN